MFGFTHLIHRQIYLFGLVLLVIALPVSLFLTSVAQIILAVNWLIEMPFSHRWRHLKNNKALLFFLIFYLVHLLGMLYTKDLEWGLHDLRIKLPMLILPLVIGTSALIDQKTIKLILHAFIATLLGCTLWQFFTYMMHTGSGMECLGAVSMPVDHIRLSLMLDFTFFSMGWLFIHERSFYRWGYIPVMIWFLIIIGLLQSLTGIFIFIIVFGIILLRIIFLTKELMLRWFMLLLTITVFLLLASFVTRTYAKFFSFQKIDLTSLDTLTLENHAYQPFSGDKMVENGQYVYMYICDSELREAWNKRSKLQYDGLEAKGYTLRYTLYRYLTSKGLRKDAAGLRKLTDNDIYQVEQGNTNYIFNDKYSIYPRFYVLYWELYQYKISKNANGFSMSQRLEASKVAKEIIRKNLLFGVGTGDIRTEFSHQYAESRTLLKPSNQIRAHNQWITFAVTFGLLGFVLIAFSLFYPIFIEHKWGSYLFLLIFLVGFLSFFDEDTLETHTPVSFFALFYALFLFGIKNNVEEPIPDAQS